MKPNVLAKYDQRVPRYTSYPTAPHFSPEVRAEAYRQWLEAVFVLELPGQRRDGDVRRAVGQCAQRGLSNSAITVGQSHGDRPGSIVRQALQSFRQARQKTSAERRNSWSSSLSTAARARRLRVGGQ